VPLRILIDVRRARDFGVGTYTRNLVNALGQIDTEDQFLLAGLEGDHSSLAALPPNFSRVICQVPSFGWSNHVGFPWFVRRQRPDLCHIPLNIVPFGMPRPYVVTIHDMSSLLYPTPEEKANAQLRVVRFRHGLKRAEKVVTVSASTQRDVEGLLGIPQNRICYIHNAPDPRFTARRLARQDNPEKAARERADILAKHQIGWPFLLYAGNIRPHKNIPRLVEAFALVREELENHPVYRDLRLVIIGNDISKHPQVRRAVIQTRVEKMVRFFGFVPFDTLGAFYEAAEAFVFPSLYEGFGLPPLEAMACGTPVISSRVASLPEVVGNAACAINPDNVFDIARGIKDVLLDPNYRAELIAAGIEQAGRFSWHRAARQVMDVYRAAVAR